jgi:tetratricopeptide (TPR) repeat protein
MQELGFSYENLGKFEEALRLYKKALHIVQNFGYRVRAAGCLNRIGALYFRRLSDLNKALRYQKERLEIVEKASRMVKW